MCKVITLYILTGQQRALQVPKIKAMHLQFHPHPRQLRKSNLQRVQRGNFKVTLAPASYLRLQQPQLLQTVPLRFPSSVEEQNGEIIIRRQLGLLQQQPQPLPWLLWDITQIRITIITITWAIPHTITNTITATPLGHHQDLEDLPQDSFTLLLHPQAHLWPSNRPLRLPVLLAVGRITEHLQINTTPIIIMDW